MSGLFDLDRQYDGFKSAQRMPQPAMRGKIREGAATKDDLVTVILEGEFDETLSFGPCRWMPHGTLLPVEGDPCIMIFDGQMTPWVVGWWTDRPQDEFVTESDVNAIVNAAKQAMYPVGSLYMAVVSTNPATILGFGTWVAFGAGRTIVGIDGGQAEFIAAEQTGGSKTHALALSEIPSHAHDQSDHSHTITDPGHVHPAANNEFMEGTTVTALGSGGSGRIIASNTDPNTGSAGTGITGTNTTVLGDTGAAGGNGAHNNLQPYIVVYMWKRTA